MTFLPIVCVCFFVWCSYSTNLCVVSNKCVVLRTVNVPLNKRASINTHTSIRGDVFKWMCVCVNFCICWYSTLELRLWIDHYYSAFTLTFVWSPILALNHDVLKHSIKIMNENWWIYHLTYHFQSNSLFMLFSYPNYIWQCKIKHTLYLFSN